MRYCISISLSKKGKNQCTVYDDDEADNNEDGVGWGGEVGSYMP